MTLPFIPDIRLGLLQQMRAIASSLRLRQIDLADQTGLTRKTVAGALNGQNDVRLSSAQAIFAAMGYELVPVPRSLVSAVHDFVGAGGSVLSRPAGEVAPLSASQLAFKDAKATGQGNGA